MPKLWESKAKTGASLAVRRRHGFATTAMPAIHVAFPTTQRTINLVEISRPMPTAATRSELERLLEDDAPYGDLTTEALGLAGREGVMRFTARDPMVVALVEDAGAIIELTGCAVKLFASAGTELAKDAKILEARGPAAGLLRSWKVAQTLIELWSGVATDARALVDAARAVAPDIAVACTRKNVPGVKCFAVAAIKAGGAVMHRLGLSETVLVFPEHRVFLGAEPLAQTVARLRRLGPEKKLVIEVTSIDMAVAAIKAGFDVIQAEKFTPELISALMQQTSHIAPKPTIAAAGGVNLGNIADYARAGVDVVVTSSPYLAKPRDVQVRIARPSDILPI